MMTETDPRPVDGVLISRDHAAQLAAALDYLKATIEAQRTGATLARQYTQLRDLLRRATHGDASTPEPANHPREYRIPEGYLPTDRAAELLGCTDNNVRDLCRRHVLTGYRIGGRWFVAEEEVLARAARRKDSAWPRSA